ncbi:MAG: T9SS type A sorting domain-containing protein [Bacteroidota bacterium]
MTVTSNNACTPQTATATYTVIVNAPLANNLITSIQQSICSGTTPTTITGSTATGGNGTTYTYSWESSTTSASTGFSAIPSTNSLNYSPSALTQTTWYRRVVSSGVCANNTTSALIVFVGDTIKPIVVTKPKTVYLDATGNGSIVVSDIENGSTDNCGIVSRSLSQTAFNCSNLGSNTVTLSAADLVGNIGTNTAIVTVLDTIKPTITATNGNVLYISANGTVVPTTSQFTSASADNCGAPTLTISPSTITCSDIGIKTITVTATDVSGNFRSATTTAVVLDPIAPVARPKARLTVYLSASGQALINGGMLDSASSDNCSITSIVLSQSTFSCSFTGNNNVTFTVQDQSGNSNSATVIVTVLDTIRPIAIAQNITVQLDATGNKTILGSQLNNGSSDFCGIASYTSTPTSFNCTNVGVNPVVLTVTDVNGNTRTANATVTVQDVTAPVVLTQNINAYLLPNGTVSITPSQVNNSSTDACGINSSLTTVTPSSFTCSNTGANTVTLSLTDVNGNSATGTATVTVIDTVRPIVVTQNITVQLNSAGNVSITPAQVNNGSSDACGINNALLSVSPSTFTCANLGANTVTLTVIDNKGNVKTGLATVTVQDVTAPVAIAQNINAYLNTLGTVTITGAQVNNSSTDACGGLTYSVSPSTLNCSNTGANTVTLTVTDGSSNSSTATATVTVIDTIRPIVNTQNITVQLNSAGTVTITPAQVNNGSTDACGPLTLSLNTSTFTCSNLGANTVILTVTDSKGNSKTGFATVTVQDVTAPVAIAQNINAYLDNAGSVTITGAQVNNGSTDACGGLTYSVSPSTFTCTNTGANTVTLTVTDGSSNSSTATATVTVIDTVRPVVVTQNITVQLNSAGNVSITPAQVNNGSSDACGINNALLSVSPSTFTCANLGANTVTLTVIDNKGNVKTGLATVTVQDVTAPVAVAQNINAYLNNAGIVTITGAQVNNGSTDACGGLTYSVSPSTFNCSNTGANSVTLTVTDGSNNSSTATATVTVIDTVRPVVVTQNITVQLNSAGTVTITPAQVNNGSSDACGINNALLSVSPSTFTCANLGANTVTLTVIDNKGNVKTGLATVTVQDVTAPVAIAQNINAYLNASGTVTITGAQVNNGSTDACGGLTYSVSPSTFNCSNTGANTVTLTVTDGSSNSSTATATVTVIDTIRPVVITQNITVQLNSAGTVTITPSQINNGSTDACGPLTLSLNTSTFNCTNVGANTVILTVTDSKGNSKTGFATVTVQDLVPPAVSAQNFTTYLNAAGSATILVSDIVLSSTDACGVASTTVSPLSFNCSNTGSNTVTFTVTDINGNSTTGNRTVNVLDTIRPIVVTQNITVPLDGSGNATIIGSQVNNGSSDACGIASMTVTPNTFNCSNVGTPVLVTLTVTDNKGNFRTGTALVTVSEVVKPVVVTKNATIQLSAFGNATLTLSQIDNGSSDNCGIATRVLSKTAFNCSNIGNNTVYLVVTDNYGNKDSAAATVIVQDLIKPTVVSQDATIFLNAAGNGSITPSDIDNGSTDNCSITMRALSKSSFNCSNVGFNTIYLIVTDAGGNKDSVTASINVRDTIRPVVLTRNITLQLDSTGNITLLPSQVDNGTSDACNFTISVLPNSFTCAQVGPNTVVLTARDASNNVSSRVATVIVQDTVRPVVRTRNINAYLNAAGSTGLITANQVNNGTSDACVITSLVVSPTSFNCSQVGPNTVTLTATDFNNNVQTGTAIVTVIDTIKPNAIARNISIYLDATGNASIVGSQLNNGSTDNCSIATYSALPNSFTCANVGTNTVILSVTDVNGNVNTATSIVTVIDTVTPIVFTQNRTIYLNGSGSASITASSINNGSTDACGISTLIVTPNSFNCLNVGNNTVTLTVRDVNNNIKTGTAIVTVLDTVRPNVITQNITAHLDATGNIIVLPSQVNNGSSDACGINNSIMSVSPNSFTCSNIGANTVTLTVIDVNGNAKTGTAIVTIADTVRPVVLTRNISVQLSATGTASITTAQINNGSTDACGINNAIMSVSPNTFTCANIGANTVTLTVTDVNGNVKTGTAIVTVADTVRPVVTTQNITVHLDATGNASITGAQINNGSTDACGIATLVANPNTFNCSNTGNNTVTLTVTDVNGNVRTGTAIVIVLDTIRPVVVTQNVSVYLSSIGTASITAAQINNGSSDACGINTSIMSVSPSSFTCSNVGNNTVTLTVTDNKGNVRTGTAIVNVIDTVRPVVITRNISVQLSNTGVATITAAQVNNGSTDNCGVNTSLLSVTPSSFTCSNIGANTVVLSVTDVNGNVRTGTAIVTIADTVRPVVVTQNITVQLNSAGSATITASQINNGSNDACGIASVTASPLTFNCTNRGANTVTLTVTDVNGNIRTGTSTVTVADTIRPVAVARNITAYLGSNGTLSLAGSLINNGSSDNCGISTFNATPSTFTCSNLGANNVMLTVTDAAGNFATAPSIVTILDTVRPIVITRNITAYLDTTGNVSITPAQVNNGSTDACGISTIVASPLTFNCTNRGDNNVTLTITDVNGNIRSGVAVVTVADTVGARVRTKNATVYLLTNGSVGVTTAQIDSSSSDNCGIASMTVTPNILRCVNVGNAIVTLTVTDVAGNVRTRNATVTVIDTIRPTVTTINRTVFLGSNGSVSITAAQINNGSFDACGVNTSLLSVTPSSFNCSNIGTNTVTLTVVDVNGNSRTGTAVVTVRDTIRPIAIARNITAQLNSLGTVTITGAQVNNGSSDTCGIASLSVTPNTFTCSNIGANTVTLTVTDGSGNFNTATAIVTVSDTVRPVVITQNITVQLNNLGAATINGSQVNNGSSDACGIATTTVSPSSFTCSNIGNNTVTLTVTDVNGNVRTGTAIVTVADTVRPVVNTQNITVQLNSLGAATITASQINNGSTDACGINTSLLSVSPSSFTCSNIGNNTVTLSVTDVNGNVRTGTAIVTVADTIRPAAVAQNLTVYLSSLGSVSITGTQVTASSSDICGIATRTVSPSTFTCSNVGNNNVVLTVTDVNGNFVTRSAVVSVLDTVRPVVTTQNITVQLNNLGAATITASQVNNGSTDACGIATTTVSPSSFTCSNIGNNTVTLTVTDVNGNIRTGTAVVAIADTVRPVVVTQNRTIYLGANGAASITAAQINNGSSDACGISTTTVSPSSFTCSSIGNNTVTLTVTDVNGNIRTGTALVTVLDTVRPNVITQNRTIYLNALGNASITAAQVNNGSNDSCGIASLSLSSTSFTCANVGPNNLTLTVTDNNGNVRTGGVVVTVLDTVRPVVNMVNGIILYLSQTGTISISPSQFNNGSTDICGIASVTISPTTITCSDIGIKAVTLTVTDVNGNVNTGTTNVVVFDPVAPVARPRSAFTAYLSANGQAIINAGLLDSASTDNCAITSRVLSQSVFNCANTGVNNILFTVQDQSGNSHSANVAVTVLDTIRPVAVVSNQSIYLNTSGTGTLTATQVNNNSTDNCGVSSIAISKTSFNCTDLGTSSITFTVTDVNGNIRTAPVSVNVFDTIRPIMRPKQNVIVYLNSTGTASITTTLVDSASTDNCSISTRTLSQSTFNCLNVGLNNVTFSGADATGNIGSRLFTVTVLDTVRPQLTTRPATIYINSVGNATLAPNQVILTGTDNCSSLISAVNTTNFTCSNIGTNTVLVTLTDASGNFITGNASVTVLDSIKPIAVTQNRTIYLNGSGTASLTAAQVNNGSSDNCGIQSLAISKTSYAAADLGINNITFTATDNSSNAQTVNVIITVLDTVRPVVVTQSRTIYLNASGVATVTAAQVNNGSTDNVGITSLILSNTQFSCADRGNNIVTLTATDISNNSTSATATIIVVDTVRPIPLASNQTIYLNGLGVGTLTAAQVNNNSTDNCGITNLTLSKTNFSCIDRGVNSTIVTLTATDASANSASTTFTVSVFDTIKPNVVVNNNIDIYLNGSGVATLTTAQVNNGSTDNCGITNLVLSKTSFNATNLGSNIVTLTATDASSNSTLVNVTVNVLDSIRPVVVAQNRTIYLGSNGTATVTAAQVNNGSSDNVGVTNLTLSKTDFNCSNIGNNIVTLTARDISNNTSSATATITVLDTIKPTLSANNLTLYLNGVGLAEITTQLANNNSFDNCGIASYSLSKTTFNCSDRGINSNIVTLTAIDNSGNSASTTFTVSVLDTLKPSIIVNNNLNLYLDASGNATLTTTQVNNGSSDNCRISTYSLSKTSFNGTNLGLNVVTFTATDASGNSNSTSVNVIVNDTVLPIVNARNRTIYLSATGSALINAIDVDSASTDNVGITTRSINKTLFNCNDAGVNFVELFISDASGNRNSKIVTVTVLDTILPVVSNVPANITLGYCGANYRPILPTATDNCGDVTIIQTAGVIPGNTYPVGVTTNTFEVTDKSGNKVTRSFTVTIYPKYVPDSLKNITVCSSVPTFALTPANAKGVYTFSGSGVTLDGKSYDPSLSGPGNFNVTYTFIDSTLCATQGNFFVTVNRAPDKPIIERKTSVVLQVQQQYNFYQWLRYGQPIAGANDQAYTTTRSGLYSVKVSTKEGCTTESDAFAVGNVGVNQATTQIGFRIYPNPSNGIMNVELDEQSVKETNIKVFDALGKLVYETSVNTFLSQIDLSKLADGTYYVRLSQEGKTSIKPIVITK